MKPKSEIELVSHWWIVYGRKNGFNFFQSKRLCQGARLGFRKKHIEVYAHSNLSAEEMLNIIEWMLKNKDKNIYDKDVILSLCALEK